MVVLSNNRFRKERVGNINKVIFDKSPIIIADVNFRCQYFHMPDVPRERLNAQVGKDIIDFTPRIFRAAIPPIVKIKSQRINNAVEIEVSDNGLGMDLKQYGSKLFGFYKRFHNHAEGKGVGLHITKTQLEMMGGRISVESEVNVGSVFKIYLTQFEQ